MISKNNKPRKQNKTKLFQSKKKLLHSNGIHKKKGIFFLDHNGGDGNFSIKTFTAKILFSKILNYNDDYDDDERQMLMMMGSFFSN